MSNDQKTEVYAYPVQPCTMKVTNFSDLAKLPKRHSFIKASDMVRIDNDLMRGDPVFFMPATVNIRKFQQKDTLVMFGVLEDGRKATLLIHGINPYFDVALNDKSPAKTQIDEINKKLQENRLPINYHNELYQAGQFKYYSPTPKNYYRIYNDTLKERAAAMKVVSATHLTATDDYKHFERIVCRDNEISYARWAQLSNYRVTGMSVDDEDETYNGEICYNVKNVAGSSLQSPNSKYKFNNNIKGIVLEININPPFDKNSNVRYFDLFKREIRKYFNQSVPIPSSIRKDKTMSMTFDIETYSTSGDVPWYTNKDDSIKCIGMTFQWIHEKTPLCNIVITNSPCDNVDNTITIVCSSEKFMLCAFGYVMKRFRPEFIMGFNDSEYDWPWMINRAKAYDGVLQTMHSSMDIYRQYKILTTDEIMSYNYRFMRIKLEAEKYAEGYKYEPNGATTIDVRTVFRRLFPTDEYSSLKYFLDKMKLPSKEDMPYKRMFAIYRDSIEFAKKYPIKGGKHTGINDESDMKKAEELMRDLAEVNKYCLVDAQRCHDMMLKRNIFIENRSLSDLTYVTLADSFFIANGMKVQNLTISAGQCHPFNLRFSNKSVDDDSDGKYTGALVFPPKKGIKTSKLTIDERKKKAAVIMEDRKTTEFNSYNDPCILDWLNITPNQEKLIYSIIDNHGIYFPKAANHDNMCNKDIAYKQWRGNDKTLEDIESEYRDEITSAFGNDKFPQHVAEFFTEKQGRPISGIDAASLYPSIIRTYNLSPEYCIRTIQEVHEAAKTHTVRKISYPGLNGEMQDSYFIWHNCNYDPAAASATPFTFGIYPYILNHVFNMRSKVKKEMKPFVDFLERSKNVDPNDPEYSRNEFEFSCFNSKQLALKVFMNTFYGICGFRNSPFYLLEVAAGVTSMGQRNIKYAYATVRSLGCEVHYGDTDSLYISIDEAKFAEFDKLYYCNKMSKLDYWTKCTELTLEDVKHVAKTVNDAFKKDNGTDFLVMQVEDVLFPCAFFAKKKYFGKIHVDKINFDVPFDKLFIRGLEIKKRGTCGLLRKICADIMLGLMSQDNLYNVIELVQRAVRKIYKEKWDISLFTQTAELRLTKQNVKVMTFAERMKARGITINPNERFSYIIALKNPFVYNERGCVSDLSVGDKMELADEVIKHNIPVDLDYYMTGSIIGQFARFIVGEQMFSNGLPEPENDEDAKQNEIITYANAVKYITEFCKQYMTTFNKMGNAYKEIYRTTKKICTNVINEYDECAAPLLAMNLSFDTYLDDLIKKAETDANKSIPADYGRNFAIAVLQNNGVTVNVKQKKIVKTELDEKVYSEADEKALIRDLRDSRHLNKLHEIQAKYVDTGRNSILAIKTREYENNKNILVTSMRTNYYRIQEMLKCHYNNIVEINSVIINLIPKIDLKVAPNDEQVDLSLSDFDIDLNQHVDAMENKAKEKIEILFANPEFKSAIELLKKLYSEFLANKIALSKYQLITSYMRHLCDVEIKRMKMPTEAEIKKIINNGKVDLNGINVVPH